MATTLEENDEEYPPASGMIVPETGDKWGLASAVVRGIARLALNRTAWLRKNTAQLGVDNDFTGRNDFFKTITLRPALVNEQPIEMMITASDSPNPPGNRWQPMGRWKSSGGQYVHLYTGSDGDSRGAFAITYNAAWNAVGNRWSKYVENKAATALILRYGSARIAGIPAESSEPWELWPVNSWQSGAEFHVQMLRTDVISLNSRVDYRNALTRTVPVPIASFHGKGRLESDGGVTQVGGIGLEPTWPVVVPEGMKFGTIRIYYDQNQLEGPGDRFELWKRSGPGNSWNTSFSVTVAAVGAPAARVTEVHTMSAADGEAPSGQAEYQLVWKLGSDAGTNNKVRAIDVARWEPGLRNG